MKLATRIKRKALTFLRSFYFIDKYYYLKDLSAKRKYSTDFIIIYNMGKVGSTSMYESLIKAFPNQDIYHLHRLNTDYLKQREKMIKSDVYGKKHYSRHLTTSLLWKPQWVKSIIETHDYNNLKIITMVREPISRNISLFFQWIDFEETEQSYRFKSRNNNYPFDIVTPKNDISELYECFFNNFVHDSHLDWLKTEMNTVINLDLLDSPFNLKNGYSIIQSEEAEVLVLKLESINSNFKSAMNDFFGKEFDLINANESTNKDINKVYKEFKKNIKFPELYINTLYESDYMKHFYSDAEIESFKIKWDKN